MFGEFELICIIIYFVVVVMIAICNGDELFDGSLSFISFLWPIALIMNLIKGFFVYYNKLFGDKK